jgi:hypothetical protein
MAMTSQRPVALASQSRSAVKQNTPLAVHLSWLLRLSDMQVFTEPPPHPQTNRECLMNVASYSQRDKGLASQSAGALVV